MFLGITREARSCQVMSLVMLLGVAGEGVPGEVMSLVMSVSITGEGISLGVMSLVMSAMPMAVAFGWDVSLEMSLCIAW